MTQANGDGFAIKNQRNKPIVFFAFPTTAEAKQTRATIERIVTETVEITPYG
jgi:hypothetical protein